MSLTHQDFAAALGSFFTADTHSGPVELKLIEATEHPRHGLPSQFRTPLSMVFEGPVKPKLTQGTYTLNHAVLGSNQWMLVPIAPLAPPDESGEARQHWYELVLS
jgi:hypothetical protein